MTVRTTPTITFIPGSDFIRVDRGIRWGIKVTDTGEARFVALFVAEGSSWTVGAMLSGLDWQEDLKASDSMRDWFLEKVLPAINAWIAQTFKANGQPPELGSLSAQLDNLIVTKLRITQQADGTLLASLDS